VTAAPKSIANGVVPAEMTMAATGPKLRPAGRDHVGVRCHVSGPHSRDYYLLLDEQGAHIFDIRLAARVREAHGVCAGRADPANACLLEIWIDDTEQHVWYVFACASSARKGLTAANRPEITDAMTCRSRRPSDA
jgi:hypothetical protein